MGYNMGCYNMGRVYMGVDNMGGGVVVIVDG